MSKNQKKAIETAVDLGGSTAGALVGAGIGAAVAGPVGVAGGAFAATAVEKLIQWAGKEIKERQLSKSENKKIGTVYSCAIDVINRKLSMGDSLREDDFYLDSVDQRSSAEEILEATLFAAQRECEEKKLPYMANLYANINFEPSIDRQVANQLLKIASELTYRQLVIIAVIKAYEIEHITEPSRLDTSFKGLKGLQSVSIASEIFDLYSRSMLFSKTAILDAAGFTPSLLEVRGIGEALFELMELLPLANDDVAFSIIALLSGISEDEVNSKKSSEIISGSVVAKFA